MNPSNYRLSLVFILFLFVLPTAVFSQVTDNQATEHVFAQFADGRFADGSYYRSALMVATETNPASCTMTLRGMTVSGFATNGVSVPLTLAADAATVVKTNGTQVFQSGYLTLTCNVPVAAQVLYGYYSSSGSLIAEATVFSSPAATAAQFIADYTENAQLGIAVANNSDAPKSLIVVALNFNQQEVARTTIQVGARSQMTPRFANELMTLPANFLGYIRIYSSGTDLSDVYALGLKFTGGAFTTIPPMARRTKPTTTSFGGPTRGVAGSVSDNQATEHVFAQFADGRFPDGSYYRSTLIVATETVAASCTMTLRGMSAPGFATNGVTVPFSLAADAATVLKTNGTQAFQSGYLTVNCNTPVAAQVLYGYYSASGGLIAEATVFSSPPATAAQLIADYTEHAQLGVAVANNSDTIKTLIIAALNFTQQELARTTIQVAPRSQMTPRFANEMMNLPANFLGYIRIYSSGSDVSDIYALGLKFTGGAFTTIPPLARRTKPATGGTGGGGGGLAR